MHELFKEKFKSLALSFSEVERAIGCPKNYLSRHINGASTLPSKWEVKINEYLAQVSPKIITAPAEWQERLAEKYAVDFNPLKEMGERLALFQQLDQFCDKRGFPLSELIGKFEELERKYGELIANSSHVSYQQHLTPQEILANYGPEAYQKALEIVNKPIPDPEIEKEGKDSQKKTKGQEKAKNGSKSDFEKDIEANLPKIPSMPVRMEGEDSLDFAARKSAWKKQYGQ